MRTNLVRGFKKTIYVLGLGTGLALTGITVHAQTGNAAADKIISTEQATTEAKLTGKWVKDKGETYYKDASGKKVRSKFVEIGKKTYYFGKSGAMEKSWVKVGKKYYYLDRQTGVLKTKGKADGIKLGKNGAAVVNKTAKKKLAVMLQAKKIVRKQTKATDTKQQKLKKVFDWTMKAPYKRYRIIAEVRTKKNWQLDYANDVFKKGKGCCVSYSSAFAYLAKECGYSKVYLCDDSEHAWVEIGGRVYDVLFARAKSYNRYYNSTYKTARLVKINKLKI